MSTATYERLGSIGYITLNRPERRNSLCAELMADLNLALDQLAEDQDCRVGVLRGAGPTFSAGYDLSEGSPGTARVVDPWADRARLAGWLRLGLRMWEFPIPIIASIQGHCLGASILFPTCADIVIAADNCIFGWARLPMGAGFVDGAIACLIGERKAKELAYVIGSRVRGSDAASFGLVNMAVPADELASATEAYAKKVARAPRSVLEIRKAAITRASSSSFRDALLAGAEWDALAHVDPAVDAMRQRVRVHGMQAVIAAIETEDDSAAAIARLDASVPGA